MFEFLPPHIRDFLDRKFIGENSIGDWVLFAGILLLGFLLKKLLAKGLTRLLFRLFKKRQTEAAGFDQLFELLRRPWNLLLMLLTIYAACQFIGFPQSWHMKPVNELGIKMVLDKLMIVALLVAFTWVLMRLTDFFGLLLLHRASKTHDVTDNQLIPFLRESIKVVICIMSFFFMLGAVFHVNVASLVAGLGIGGLAVALAAKESLENLLASVTIFLDKPFVIGDRVMVDNITGSVERIGFRSTRMRTDDQEYVTVPNKRMVDNEVFNLSQRPVRRVRINITLEHKANSEQIRLVRTQILSILNSHKDLVNEECRAHFFAVTGTGFEIQVTYFIKVLDPDLYLNVREEINFAIFDLLQKENLHYSWTNPTPAG
ncbi:MAG: mechanosensitive ion channel family protein [Bacteroidia bacterium]|jgi:MscS family membrane protein|nr:mechanosensitive ion channel family protein [Bacteroidia bacterium]